MEGAEEGVEMMLDSKDMQQQSKAFDKLTEGVEDRQVDSTRVQKRMKKIFSSETMDIPDGVSIKVEGPRGDFQLITDENGKKKLKIEAWFGTHKMRLIYAHFPINASITNHNKGIKIHSFLLFVHPKPYVQLL